MWNEGVAAATTAILAIISLAMLAVVVSKQANTQSVLQAGFSGLASLIQTAVAPVSGGSSLTSGGG